VIHSRLPPGNSINTAPSSLPQDQRLRPENASGGRRARAFHFLSYPKTSLIYIVFGLRAEYDNTSIKSRTLKILRNVRVVSHTHSQSHRICRHHTGQFAVDRAAATRFIKHAIAQAKDIPPASASDSGPTDRVPPNTDGPANTAPVLAPVKVTEKMLEREEYQRALREEGSEEESGDLKVIDGGEGDNDDEQSSDNSPSQASATKGKSKAPSEKSMGKRRRRAIDPFAGLCTLVQSHYPISS
jgi:hypothetical protein